MCVHCVLAVHFMSYHVLRVATSPTRFCFWPDQSQFYGSFSSYLCLKFQLKPGQQIPSPSELMGKILIKNKKGSHQKPAQTKKTATAATEQTTTTALTTQVPNSTSQDPANPAASTQENQGALGQI